MTLKEFAKTAVSKKDFLKAFASKIRATAAAAKKGVKIKPPSDIKEFALRSVKSAPKG